mmetsp:Transcript_26579/g.40338  ORF Transcript_26579/g.40338 Transcript_26579/m.40338 type:complete len:499 (+) Transcript_26579:4-1500(+)
MTTDAVQKQRGDVAQAWKWICIAHATRCLGDRSYTFFLPLFFSSQCKTTSALRPTATVTIVQNLAVALLSTKIAKIYSHNNNNNNNRREAKQGKSCLDMFVKATVLENFAVALGALIIYVAFSKETTLLVCSNPLSSSRFRYALIFAAIDAVFSSFLYMIISKEWVASLFGSRNSKIKHDVSDRSSYSLSKANARLSQIDLVVAALCPIIISWGIESFGYYKVISFLIAQHLAGSFIIVFSAKRAVSSYPSLTTNIRIVDEAKEQARKGTKGASSFTAVYNSLPVPTKLVSLAYALLYFSVLSPGGILNAWMNSLHHGRIDVVNEKMIAYAGSTSQLLGAVSTLMSPYIIRYSPTLHHASALTQWAQSVCILFGAYSFYRINNNYYDQYYGDEGKAVESSFLLLQFIAGISLSRVGLWSFDLVERQLLQESVSKSNQTVFFNGEKSVTQILSLLMMGLCYIFSGSESFVVLVSVSVAAVTLSSTLLGVSLLYTVCTRK